MSTNSESEMVPEVLDLSAKRLSVVSNRLPFERDDEGAKQLSPGGLARAVLSATDGMPVLWFGRAGQTGHVHPEVEAVSLSMSPELIRGGIDGFSNRTLWPALHGLADEVEQTDAWWDEYLLLSEQDAAILAHGVPLNGVVWVHDYQLFGLAMFVRRLRRDLRIGLSCHTPFHGPTMRRLRNANALAVMLDSFDLIGTQTTEDEELLQEFLGTNRSVTVESIPVGLDSEKWVELRDDDVIDREAAILVPDEGILAVGIERADYTKGLVEKLTAIERLLDESRMEPDDFRLVQIAPPTRESIPAYLELQQEIRELVDRINVHHVRSDGLDVVDLRTESVPPTEVAALMRAADVAVITPRADGMNLVALEFAIINADRHAELILGEGAGAAEFIGDECLLVDGSSEVSIADAIERVVQQYPTNSLAGSARRGATATAMTSERWGRDFLDALVDGSIGRHAVR